jgi:4'-phosphopantetheinyl transferase
MFRSKILYTRVTRRNWDPDYLRLPPLVRERIAQFKRREDRDARVACYGLLLKSISNLTGSEPALDRLVYTIHGRPSLSEFPYIDFNLSHSGDYAICGAISGGRIGIDVERVYSIDLEDGRAAFSDVIWHEIKTSNSPREAFYRAWTRMEAVAKAEGFGVAGPIQAIRFEAQRACYDGRVWHLLEVPISGYSCHIASSRQLSLADVEEMF